jgi:hypothetical protein
MEYNVNNFKYNITEEEKLGVNIKSRADHLRGGMRTFRIKVNVR